MRSIRFTAIAVIAFSAPTVIAEPVAHADNKRLNNSIAINIYTAQHQAGCLNDVDIDPALRFAAQRHALNLLDNRNLLGDIGSDGTNPQDRAAAAGFSGRVAETVAINPALAINAVEVMNQWFGDPAEKAIMVDCAHTAIGVWSENSIDRTVVVAVYGAPA